METNHADKSTRRYIKIGSDSVNVDKFNKQ